MSQVLANVSGVLGVQCLENNGGHIRPPTGGLNFNISVQIQNHTSVGDSTDTNGGIKALVEIRGHDTNVAELTGNTETLIGVTSLSSGTVASVYF